MDSPSLAAWRAVMVRDREALGAAVAVATPRAEVQEGIADDVADALDVRRVHTTEAVDDREALADLTEVREPDQRGRDLFVGPEEVQRGLHEALILAGLDESEDLRMLGDQASTQRIHHDTAQAPGADRFEGTLYERKRVAVRSDPLGLMSAETYVVKKDELERLSSQSWDVDSFRKEHLAEWLEVCAAFHEKGKR